jgi:hypothetical protein
MTAPTMTDMYRQIRSDNLELKRQVEELEMRLRLSQAREQKALDRARLAESNSRQWHALLLKHKVDAIEVRR